MHSNGNWDDLRYFLAAAEKRSFAAAGRELAVEHTTVARRVAALEERLGAKLFDRARDGLRLTSAGDHVLERAAAIEGQVQGVERLAGTFEDTEAGEVILSTGSVLADSIVLPGLSRLSERHPFITLRMQLGRRLVSLQQREADVGLRMRPAAFPAAEDDVVVTRVGSAELALYASRAYLKGKPPLAARPEKHCQIRYGSVPWEPGEAHMSSLPALHSSLSCDDMSVVRQACVDGLGLAVLPTFYARRARLVPVLRDVDSAVLSVVVHPDLKRVKRVRAVVEWLKAETRQVLNDCAM